MPSITLMMSAIWLEEVLMASMVCTTSLTTLPPRSATSAALEAQADALKREDEALLAEIELNTHTVLLYKALGGGWSPDPAPKSEPIPVAQWLPTE